MASPLPARQEVQFVPKAQGDPRFGWYGVYDAASQCMLLWVNGSRGTILVQEQTAEYLADLINRLAGFQHVPCRFDTDARFCLAWGQEGEIYIQDRQAQNPSIDLVTNDFLSINPNWSDEQQQCVFACRLVRMLNQCYEGL